MDQPTCSVFCPCPAIVAFSNSNVNLTQAKLQDWGRYVSVDNSNANLDYTKATEPSTTAINNNNLVPLMFAKEGATTKTYNSYKECFDGVLSKSTTKTGDSDADKEAT